MPSQLCPPSGYGCTIWTLSGHYFELPVTLCTSIEAEPLLDFYSAGSSRSLHLPLRLHVQTRDLCLRRDLRESSGVVGNKAFLSLLEKHHFGPAKVNSATVRVEQKILLFLRKSEGAAGRERKKKEQSLKSPENKDKRRKKKQ